MNHSFNLQCCVCETSYLIKHQIGYRSTDFFFECPTCGIMLSGQVKIDNENLRINSKFINLKQDKDSQRADYFIQMSGEFYDNKLKRADDSSVFTPGSFILQSSDLGFEKTQHMSNLAHYIIDEIPEYYKKCSNVIDLIVSRKDNKKYVYSELKKLDPEIQSFIDYPTKMEFIKNYDKYIYPILFSSVCYPFRLLLDKNDNRFNLSITRQNLEEIFSDYPDELLELKKEFQPVISELTTDIVNRLKSYVSLLPKLNPVVTSETFMAYDIESIKDIKGLNTVDYNELLSNYADTYEVLGKTLSIFVSMNNIQSRGALNQFDNNKYKSISQFNKDTIGNKLTYVKENLVVEMEYMDLSLLNNKIR